LRHNGLQIGLRRFGSSGRRVGGKCRRRYANNQ